ncbi:hypothetical protein C2E23DRAFT_461314 [Lenzites betulinus]|nr:hypothetical protein C2E23DRAFT_461314 [Lenzites betulinus]
MLRRNRLCSCETGLAGETCYTMRLDPSIRSLQLSSRPFARRLSDNILIIMTTVDMLHHADSTVGRYTSKDVSSNNRTVQTYRLPSGLEGSDSFARMSQTSPLGEIIPVYSRATKSLVSPNDCTNSIANRDRMCASPKSLSCRQLPEALRSCIFMSKVTPPTNTAPTPHRADANYILPRSCRPWLLLSLTRASERRYTQ